MLVDANNRRIDKAPTAIVSDPRRPDRAVEPGVSCMSCHLTGIQPKTIGGHRIGEEDRGKALGAAVFNALKGP